MSTINNSHTVLIYMYLKEKPGCKKAVLNYKLLSSSDRYSLLEVELLTGRHHQIRCQMASIGCPIKGDLKYGAKRSNPDGSISLLIGMLHWRAHYSDLSFERWLRGFNQRCQI